MKLKRIVQSAAIAASVTLLAACSTGTQPATGIVDGSGNNGMGGAGGTTSAGIDSNGSLTGASGVADATNSNTVYFDLNKDVVKGQYQGLVGHYANYLLAHPQTKVQISGYTDISGSREWNLTLSERRADAVKKALEKQGVKPSQIEVAGYGQEYSVPACSGKVTCWQNRRAVFQVYS